MIATITYHRVGKGKYTNSLELFSDHLKYIKEHYPVLLPGDVIPKKRLSLCLTFDDATFDFYRFIFPLLKELNLRALLGVPVGYIVKSTTLDDQTRLTVPYPLMMQEGVFETKVPFCTFAELKEMVESGCVEVASHSLSHGNLTLPFIKYDREIIRSKEILESELPQAVTSFIYPFGRVLPFLHEKVMKTYAYAFRLGSAYHFDWDSRKKPLTRLIGDQMESKESLFALPKKSFFFLKGMLNHAKL